MPALNGGVAPAFSLRSSRTRGSNFFTISGVRSVEPSSTTMISRSVAGKSCSSTLTIACSMKRSWLYVSISTLANTLVRIYPPSESLLHRILLLWSLSRLWWPLLSLLHREENHQEINLKTACTLFSSHPEDADDDSPRIGPRALAHSCTCDALLS